MTKKVNITPTKLSLAQRYDHYQDISLIDRCQEYARWTLPQIYPDPSQGTNQQFIEYDCQSVGALLVNKLSTKLAGLLFPAKQSFFTLSTSEDTRKYLSSKHFKDIVALEKKAASRVFLHAAYAQIIQLIRLLIVTGQVLVYRQSDRLRIFSTQYHVTKRNNVGEVIDCIVKEKIPVMDLDSDMQAALADRTFTDTDDCELYTRIQRIVKYVGKERYISWEVTQELEGIDLGFKDTYTDRTVPYFVVDWSLANGDNYARGYVEEYKSDFYKLSTVSRAATDYEFEMLRLIHLVNPSGQVDIKKFDSAGTGDYVYGQEGAVTPYDNGDYQKLKQVYDNLTQVEARLNIAFMRMDNSRDAERVTAYEIRNNAIEVEQVLGGVYSQLSESLHTPLANLLLNETIPDIFDDIDKGNLELNVLTGLESLARSASNQGLVVAASEVNAVVPVLTQIHPKYSRERMTDGILAANGVNIEDIVATEEELLAEQEQQAQASAAQQEALMATQQQQVAQMNAQESAIGAIDQSQAL